MTAGLHYGFLRLWPTAFIAENDEPPTKGSKVREQRFNTSEGK